jgi:hypothetical protein
MQPCPDLQPVKGELDMGGLLQKNVDTANAYYECAARHQALIDWAQ